MIGKFLPTAIALFGAMAFANHAEATCGKSKRVSDSNSECLEETHSNSSYTVTNHCRHDLRVKVDIKGGSDKTITVGGAALQACGDWLIGSGPNTEWRCQSVNHATPGTEIVPTVATGSISTSWGRKIRAVTCCSDLSDCDRKASDSYPPS